MKAELIEQISSLLDKAEAIYSADVIIYKELGRVYIVIESINNSSIRLFKRQQNTDYLVPLSVIYDDRDLIISQALVEADLKLKDMDAIDVAFLGILNLEWSLGQFKYTKSKT